MTEYPADLVELALAFTRWAGDRDLLSHPCATSPAKRVIAKETGSDRPPGETGRPPQAVEDQGAAALRGELGDALDVIAGIIAEKAIDFVGICPAPRVLVITAHRKPTPAARNSLPRRTASGIQVHFEFGARPEIRLASAAISPARTQVLRDGRYPCGTSISLANAVSTGTMGALVEDEDGRIHGLTCNHVTGMCNNTQRGLQVVAPGLLDVRPGSLDPFTLGHHSRLAELAIGLPDNVRVRDNVDAALFEISDRKLVTSMQLDHFDTPTTTAAFTTEMLVEKVGRATERTRGRLIGWSPAVTPAPANVGVFKGTIYFEQVLLVVSRGKPFAEPGDSGALVVTEAKDGKRHAVGVVFAVSADRLLSYVAPIDEVLKRLKVKLVGGLNVSIAPRPPGVP